MKRGKDEKIMGPMFPRLHVNDAEKGGSRAPPRNKMALYEQLSIPSQRVSHVTHVVLPCNRNNNVTDSVPPLSQGGGNEWGVFFPWQAHPRHPSEKQFSPYSEQSTPLAQVEKKKKLDEDDDKVPIFIHSVPKEFYIYRNDLNLEKLSSSDPPYLPPLSNFQKAKEIGVLENNMKQEGKEKKEENPNELVAGWKQTVPLLSHEPGDDVANSIETDKSGLLELCDESEDSQLFGNTAEKNYSNSQEALPSEDQNIDLSNETVSCEDGSCRLLQPGNLERGDSVSESYILDTVSVPDITPDDVVGIIGRKHFWKARRAIVNQQRIFAVQVFELHRLIKVQRLIATSSHLLLEDSTYFGKPIKPLSGNKRPSDYALKARSKASKGKSDSENPSHRKKGSAGNTVEKESFPSAQNGVPLLSRRPLTGSPPAPSVIGSDQNARTPCFNHPQVPHWLIPVMSPTEGLVYKPYPGTGFIGQACGGCCPPGSNPVIGNFLSPAYGVPAPPPQDQFPSFPPFGPHSYFPPYSTSIMTFSGSSVEQTNPTPIPGRLSAGEAMSTVPTQKNIAVPVRKNWHAAEDIEVQSSSANSPNEIPLNSRASSAVEGRNMLPLFPPSPATDASKACSQLSAPEQVTRAIKVVPHNGVSASESAARVFLSIQEERKQYDSV